jgi:ketohexokinase
MPRILAVGIATLDIINEVAAYPSEDAELRALSQVVRRGGNATNTLVVLSQLGHQCVWGGVLVDEPDAPVVLDEINLYGINIDYCIRLADGKLPTSYVTLSRSTGSRTIVHFRDLPEYSSAAFARIPLETFEWIHFEGRNVAETLLMMQRIHRHAPHLRVSLEVEKTREGIEQLFPFARLLLVSSDYMRESGREAADQLQIMKQKAPQADLVCTLGEKGSIGLTRQGQCCSVPACFPEKVVDTLAAGDTFNAGMIDGLCRQHDLEHAMRFASMLAGKKCGQSGLHGLQIPRHAGEDDCGKY